MASMAAETDFVKKPAYPERLKPKATRAPAPSSRAPVRPKPASVATMPGPKSKKPLDPMEIARMIKLAGLAGHAR